MPIPVEAYIEGAVVRGAVERAGHVREALEAGMRIDLVPAIVTAHGAPPRTEASISLVPDDVLLAAEPVDAVGPVHALWHPLHLVAGPYLVEGELPTMPGFDPAKALARPTGTFVLLRDARVTLVADRATTLAAHRALLVNRYTVERVEADLMLGFFFPGAAMAVDEAMAGAAAHPDPPV